MFFDFLKKKRKKNNEEEFVNSANLTKKIGETNVTYHFIEDAQNVNGSAKVVIDNIEPSPMLKRSKELIDKLNLKDNHGTFKTECIKFQNDLKEEVEKISEMTNSFIDKINKYMCDTNVV